MGVAEVRYRYRLRVNEDQAAALQAVFDVDRFVWNQALGRWEDLWRHETLSLSYGDMAAELTDWRGRYEWLAAQPQCPEQQVLRCLYRAIKAYFDQANPAGRPRFKKRRHDYATAEWTRNGFKVSRHKAGTAVVALPAADTTQRCSSCGTKAKPRIELSDRMFNCSCCGLVVGRDRNAARNLNPDRPGPGGRTEPPGTVPVGHDGHETKISAGILAA